MSDERRRFLGTVGYLALMAAMIHGEGHGLGMVVLWWFEKNKRGAGLAVIAELKYEKPGREGGEVRLRRDEGGGVARAEREDEGNGVIVVLVR
ncbi:hypothetical protein M0R45_005025 [Rubus argutus]|uniref:Uncharacterized protein n=1 Tax=Rubus argutus TaxID=59490 RepID=A0AAW1YLZ5_RUBAR